MDLKQLLALLSALSWDDVSAVINALNRPKLPYEWRRDPASGLPGSGVRVVAPGGLVAVASSQQAEPRWNAKWLAQLSEPQRARVLEVVFSAQLS